MGFFQQLGVQAGYNIMYNTEKAKSDVDIELKQQKVAENKMTLMQEKLNLDARRKVQADTMKDMADDKRSVTNPERLAEQAGKQAAQYAQLGDLADSDSAYARMKMFTKMGEEARVAVAEKASTALEVTAKAADEESSNPSPEASAATDKAYAASGGDMTNAPLSTDPRRPQWVKDRIRGNMSAEKALVFDQNERDKKDVRDATAEVKKQAHEDRIQAEKARKDSQDADRQLRKETAISNNLLKQALVDAKLSAPTKVSAKMKDVALRESTALSESAVSIGNLAQLTQSGTVNTDSGSFQNLSTNGLFGASAASLTRAITSEQSNLYFSTMLPLARTAAQIQSGSSYKMNEAQTDQAFKEFITQPGMTHVLLLDKMGQLRQTIDAGITAQLAAETFNPAQDEKARADLEKVKSAIPWVPGDVLAYRDTQKKNQTFGDWLQKNRGVTLRNYKKEEQAAVDKNDKARASKAAKMETASDFYSHFGMH